MIKSDSFSDELENKKTLILLLKRANCILRLEISFSAKAIKRLSWLESKV